MSPTHCPKALLTPAPRPALTQLVKVGLGATGTGHRADQPGLEKSAPFVHQDPLATSVILWGGAQGQPQVPEDRQAPPPAPPPSPFGGGGTDIGSAPSPQLPYC